MAGKKIAFNSRVVLYYSAGWTAIEGCMATSKILKWCVAVAKVRKKIRTTIMCFTKKSYKYTNEIDILTTEKKWC